MDDEQNDLDYVSRLLDHLGYEVQNSASTVTRHCRSKITETNRNSSTLFDGSIIRTALEARSACHTIRKIDPNAKVCSTYIDHPSCSIKKARFTAALEKPYK